MLELNPSSTVPLYAQLADRLLARIVADEFAEGARIPSEHELAKRYGVGRPTVRQATEVLLRRGYLERRRGAGTFVRPRGRTVDLFSLGGTAQSFQQQGIELCTEWVVAPHRVLVSEEGAHPLARRAAFFSKRVARVAGEGVLLEAFWFDAEVFPALDRMDLTGRSLSELALAQYRMEPTHAEQRFLVEHLAGSDADLLGVRPDEAVLRVERTLHFGNARGAVFVVMHCRTDRFEFSQTIGGRAEAAGAGSVISGGR